MTNTTTATATETTATVADAPAAEAQAMTRLNQSMARTSLDDLVQARTRRSLLLVDCSGSMSTPIRTGGSRHDALCKVVASIRETHPVPVAAFSGHSVRLVDEDIPYPGGGTPMAAAILYGQRQGATHLVLVTDGQPSDLSGVYDAARNFGGPIDTFFCGDAGDYGIEVCKEIARLTGGQFHLSAFEKPKELSGKITLLLGSASEVL